MQNKFDAVRDGLKKARFAFINVRNVRNWTLENEALFFGGLRALSEALDSLAALEIDMDDLSKVWAPIFDATPFICFDDDDDATRINSALQALAWATEKELASAKKLVATRFAMALCALPLDDAEKFADEIGVEYLVEKTRKEVTAMGKEIKAAEKARKAAEKAAEKARKAAERAAAPKKRRTSVKAEYEAILAQLQKEVGLKAVKDPTTGKYVFTKAAA